MELSCRSDTERYPVPFVRPSPLGSNWPSAKHEAKPADVKRKGHEVRPEVKPAIPTCHQVSQSVSQSVSHLFQSDSAI